MSELRGKLRQKIPNGPYYYRLMVANGVRREFALKTCEYDDACKKAAELDSIWEAPTHEVAIAQINAIRGFSQESKNLPFDEVWRRYEIHPDRAMPHTIAEQNSYRSTFNEFVRFVSQPFPGRKKHSIATGIAEVSPQVCEDFSAYLKTTNLSVHTHNRKYLPGRQTKSFSGIVALDTSPSTYGNLPMFASELMGLLKSFGKFDIRVIECASSILQVWTVSSSDPMTDLTQHQFKVGGGTDFTPVFEYIRDHHLTPNVLIYFTDGDGSCPKTKPPYPVLWMLTRGGVAPVPWGQVIYYKES